MSPITEKCQNYIRSSGQVGRSQVWEAQRFIWRELWTMKSKTDVRRPSRWGLIHHLGTSSGHDTYKQHVPIFEWLKNCMYQESIILSQRKSEVCVKPRAECVCVSQV